jgi:hypothetical protein
LQQTTQTSICRGKVRCAVPKRLFQKTGLRVWFFTQFVLGVAFLSQPIFLSCNLLQNF